MFFYIFSSDLRDSGMGHLSDGNCFSNFRVWIFHHAVIFLLLIQSSAGNISQHHIHSFGRFLLFLLCFLFFTYLQLYSSKCCVCVVRCFHHLHVFYVCLCLFYVCMHICKTYLCTYDNRLYISLCANDFFSKKDYVLMSQIH